MGQGSSVKDSGLSIEGPSTGTKFRSLVTGVSHSVFVDLSLALIDLSSSIEDPGMSTQSLSSASADSSWGIKELGTGTWFLSLPFVDLGLVAMLVLETQVSVPSS